MSTFVPIQLVKHQLITVIGERVEQYDCYIGYNNERILINVINKDTKMKYIRILRSDSQYWKDNYDFFGDNFLLLGKFLKESLACKKGEYYYHRNQENSNLTIQINERVLGFVLKLNIYLNF